MTANLIGATFDGTNAASIGSLPMLVLSRYKDQKILIGNDVVVTIVDVRGDKIRVGIEAPKGVVVNRSELADQIKRQGLRRQRKAVPAVC